MSVHIRARDIKSAKNKASKRGLDSASVKLNQSQKPINGMKVYSAYKKKN